MDALTALQYLPILGLIVGALVLALAIALIRGRGSRPVSTAPLEPEPAESPPILPNVMLLLVAVALGVGLLLLLPAMMILRYFPSWQVDVLLIVAAAILLVPMVYLWRARSF